MHLVDEVLDHLLGDIDVGDDAVAQRADRFDLVRGLAHHQLGVVADGLDLLDAVDRLDRDHRRLVQDNPPSAHVYQAYWRYPDRSPCRGDIHLNQRVQNMLYPSLACCRKKAPTPAGPRSRFLIQTLVKADEFPRRIQCFAGRLGLGYERLTCQ